MQDIVIKEINKDLANYLVFGTTVDSPLFQLQEISKEFNSSKNFNVLFDQLLQIGNAENRFLLLHFNGNEFELNSAKNIDNSIVDNEIREIIADFLKQNKMLLKYSILISSQKELISKGGVV